jgi:hypothetical protein
MARRERKCFASLGAFSVFGWAVQVSSSLVTTETIQFGNSGPKSLPAARFSYAQAATGTITELPNREP